MSSLEAVFGPSAQVDEHGFPVETGIGAVANKDRTDAIGAAVREKIAAAVKVVEAEVVAIEEKVSEVVQAAENEF